MADQEHIERIRQGVEEWNQWRKEHFQIKPDLSCADLSNIFLFRAKLYDVNLYGANLSNANLSGARINDADLSSVNLNDANLSDANLFRANLRGVTSNCADFRAANLSHADLSHADFKSSNFNHANLKGANLTGANLSFANLSFANLNQANLSTANLSNVYLYAVQSLGTSFEGTTLTGACIQDWNINSTTNLQGVVCDYVFTRWNADDKIFTNRRPHDLNRTFAPGEFTQRYQIVLETVDLFFNTGINWKAFLSTFTKLQSQCGEDNITVQGFERKGDGFEVRLAVSAEVDTTKLEKEAYEKYETELRIVESRYHVELQAKDKEIEIYKQQSTNLWELAKLAASRPITVEAKAVAENQSHSETFNNNLNGAIIGSLANKMQDHASQHSTQYIGTTPSEITTLIQSLRSLAASFPQSQRTEAIDHLEDLEGDLKQPPEKRKPSRIKATLLALVASATAISGTVASTNEFVGQVQELSEKLGIPLPIEQVQPASQSDGVIDVEAIQRKKP